MLRFLADIHIKKFTCDLQLFISFFFKKIMFKKYSI